MKRATIITTLQHNVGDDFVREGIIYLLTQAIGEVKLDFVHKHLPITARPEFDWIRSSKFDERLDRLSGNLALRVTKRIDSSLPLKKSTDRICTADILIQSGGPVYWANAEGDCAHTEWWDPLIERRWLSVGGSRPFLNLAGGTCQRYESDASEFAKHPKVLDHIRRAFDVTALTTVRDQLSVRVLEQAGRSATLLPCTSLFAIDRLGITASPGEYVVLNYMPTGGHFVLGQSLDADAWERRFLGLANHLAKDEKVIMVCHNKSELAAARRLLPQLQSFYSEDFRDYLRLYSKAKWGILNRVHGCFALASLGKPSAVVGSDSRARMVRQLGLADRFVNDATEAWLESTVEQLVALAPEFPERMNNLKSSAKESYQNGIAQALGAINA